MSARLSAIVKQVIISELTRGYFKERRISQWIREEEEPVAELKPLEHKMGYGPNSRLEERLASWRFRNGRASVPEDVMAKLRASSRLYS